MDENVSVEALESIFESVKVARLRPGDILIYRSLQRLNDRQRTHMSALLDKLFPGFDSILLEDGEDIAVLRPEPGLLGRLFGKLRGAR